MTDAHKAALARGRAEGRVVREYLEALRASRPSPGRKRTPDTITRRLADIEVAMAAGGAFPGKLAGPPKKTD